MSRLRFALTLIAIWTTLLVAAELALRGLGFAPAPGAPGPAATDKFRPDPELVWALKPSWSGREPNGAAVRTNRLGQRGDDPRPGAEGRGRVLFLGDSVVFGHQLEQDETIPARVEAGLRARVGSEGPEVRNAGVPGYSTFQSEVYYRERGAQQGAELVLLGFCLNDVTERYNWLAAYGGSAFFMGDVDTRVGLSWPRRLWHGSALRGALTAALRSAGLRGETYRVARLWTDPDAPHIAEAWQRVFGEIDRLAADAAASGARFAVVIFPYASQVRDARVGDVPQRRLVRHLRSRGIAHLDLLDTLRAEAGRLDALYQDRNHFTAAGAALVADAIAAFVADRGLLDLGSGRAAAGARG